MKTVIACNDHALSAKICSGLKQVGIECPTTNFVSLESCGASIADGTKGAALLILFGSSQFAPADLSLLKQTCTACPQSKIVAVGPARSPQIVLEAVHCGAADFLDTTQDFEAELRQLITRLKAAAEERTSVGRLLTVISPTGGTGASVLATNLAAALAKREGTCALLDFHIRGGDLATLLRCNPRHTLLSLAGKAHQLDRAMFDQSLVKHESGVHLLASPAPFSDYRQLNLQPIQQVVQFARASYPTVVVDLEDMEHAEQVRTLAASDRIIVVLRLDFVALNRAKRIIEQLQRANVRQDCITLVASRVGQPKEMGVESFAEVLGLPINHQIPDDPATVNMAVNLGMPLVLSSPKTKVAESVVKLAESLIGIPPSVAQAGQVPERRFTIKWAASLLGLVPA